jgi:peptidoglycan-N-acetylglucosamine deacetylase
MRDAIAQLRTPRELVAILARRVVGSITHILTEEPVTALTFDDGPHPEYTPWLLDILERYGARGTFFMLGDSASKHPELVKRIAQAGHAIGNHSWDHPSFPLIPSGERRRQIQACERALVPFGQKLFRPPYGEQSIMSRLDAFSLGYAVIGWNVDVGDWCETDSFLMADRLVKGIHPGSVVVFHDALYDEGKPKNGPKLEREACVDRKPMLMALQIMFERLGSQMRFVTVPELLRYGSPHEEFWFKRTSND